MKIHQRVALLFLLWGLASWIEYDTPRLEAASISLAVIAGVIFVYGDLTQ